MIKKLKIRFVATIMVILSLFFILILVSINYFNYQTNEQQISSLLNALVDSDGRIHNDPILGQNAPNPVPPSVFDRERTFSIKLDSNADLFSVNESTDLSALSEEVTNLTKAVLASGKNAGSVDGYRYLVAEKSYGRIIVLVNQLTSNEMADRLMMNSLIIGGISMFVLFFISLFLANLMVRPVEESFKKQKRFVSDASHELKTPLSVISPSFE